MRKCIIFNSNVPRSGKDTAANHIVSLVNSLEDSNLVAHKHNFKDLLIEATARMLGVSTDEFLTYYDHQTCMVPKPFKEHRLNISQLICSVKNKWWKDVPMYTIGERVLSKRQALIHCSEELFKPMLGKEVFGQMFVDNLPEEGIICSGDGGFSEETLPVIRKLGKGDVLIVRITRNIKSDVYDSRSMLQEADFPEDLRPHFVDIKNDGTIQEFLEKVTLQCGKFINGGEKG